MTRDESLSRSLMLLCVGAAVLMLFVRGQATSSSLMVPLKLPSRASLTARHTESPQPRQSTRLVVDLSQRQVFVYQRQKLQASYPLAVGQAGWETPTGTFRVTQMQVNPAWQHPITEQVIPPGPDNPLGARWIGFWSDGHSHIGFHGTNQEDLVGGAVSHGCLRMRNQDIMALYQQVERGTPVIVKH